MSRTNIPGFTADFSMHSGTYLSRTGTPSDSTVAGSLVYPAWSWRACIVGAASFSWAGPGAMLAACGLFGHFARD